MNRRPWLGTYFGPWILRVLGVDHPERPVLELEAGAGVTLAVADLPESAATKVTISAPGGGGGGVGPTITNSSSGPLHDVATDDDGTPASVIRFTAAGPSPITIGGFEGGTPGRQITIVAVNAPIVLWHQASGSSAANRTITWSGNLFVAAGAAAQLVYDGATSRWRVTGVGAVAVQSTGCQIVATDNGVPFATSFAYDQDEDIVSFTGETLYTAEFLHVVDTETDDPVTEVLQAIPTSSSGTIIVTVTMRSEEEFAAKRFGAWSGEAKFYRLSSGAVAWLDPPPNAGALAGAAKDDTTAATSDAVAWLLSASNLGLTITPAAEDLTRWDVCVRVQWTRKVP